MANTEFYTRLQLKYDSYENWSDTTVASQKGNLVLLAGEIGICTIPSGATAAGVQNPPHVMFKVGDGSTAFHALPWASAKAADVYAWAKEDKVIVSAEGAGNVVASISWDSSLNGGKGGIKYTTASVATSEGLKALQDALTALTERVDAIEAAIEAMDADLDVTEGNYITGITQVNGKITAIDQKALPTDADTVDGKHASDFATAEQGGKADSAMQSITVLGETLTDGGELTVEEAKTALGLGSAAYTEANAYATAAQGELADSALQKADITTGGANGTIAVEGADVAVKGLGTAAYTEASAYDVAGAAKAAVEDLKLKYNSNDKTIVLYGTTKDPITTLNASAFIKDGMVESARYDADNNKIIITFNTDAGKEDIEVDVAGLVDTYTAGRGITVEDNVIANTGILEVKEGATNGTIAVDGTDVAVHGLGSAAYTNADAYATAAQGEKADTAVQPAAIADMLTKTEAPGYNDILTKTVAATTYQPKGEYASAAQGALADTAVQPEDLGDAAELGVATEISPMNAVNEKLATEKAVADALTSASTSFNNQLTNKIATLDSTVTGEGPVVTNVVQTDGKVTVTKGNITLDQVSANTEANYVIFNCGSSTTVI